MQALHRVKVMTLERESGIQGSIRGIRGRQTGKEKEEGR